jgi:hypothetical protein
MASHVGAFFIVLFILVLLAAGGWVAYTQVRARQRGLPPPTLSSYNPFASRSSSANYPGPAPGGIVGWFNDKIRAFKNRNNRVAGGAYEEPLGSTRGRGANRGFGPLDPDDAWDTRVGTEAEAYGPGGHYEEQELGLRSNEHGAYGGSGYSGGMAVTPGPAPPGYGDEEASRGRGRSREPQPYAGGSQNDLGRRYEESGIQPKNPFADTAEPSNMSLRGVSPRPMDGERGSAKKDADNHAERRSMFRENV